MKPRAPELFLFFLLLTVVFIMPHFFPVGKAVFFRLFFIAVIMALGLVLFKKMFVDGSVKPRLAKLSVFLFSLFIIFFSLESVFMFIPKSHGIGYSLGSQLWFSKYWNPVNSFGFRDAEPDSQAPAVFFIGDSFTAGHGLKSVSERYSDIVRDELNAGGRKFPVINMGKNDIDTRGEIGTLQGFSAQTGIVPGIIVLQYFGNDIHGAALEKGIRFNGFSFYEDIPGALSFFVEGSYFVNFCYWTFQKEDASGYIRFLSDCFGNPAVVNLHMEELKWFADYADGKGIKLIVVVFPFFQDVEMSKSMYADRVTGFFRERNVTVIEVSELTKGLPVSEAIVNNNDPHASAKVNSMVAHAILETVKKVFPE